LVKSNSHILIVSSEFPPLPGGIGNHAYHLAKHLQASKGGVAVIADQRTLSGQEEHDFDAQLAFNVHRVTLRRQRIIMYLRRIYLLFTHIKTSEVVLASGKFSLWIVAFASLFYQRQYIAIIHGSEVNFSQRILKMAVELSLKRFNKVIAVSKYTKQLVAEVHSDIVVIPNGIDLQPSETPNVSTVSLQGFPKLLTVGNVTERKGQLNVIKQLPELLKVYPDIHYYIVGLPTEKAAFLEVAERLGVATHVTFYGRATAEELQAFFKQSDVFVMLSAATASGDVEGFGIALIEANYFGLPCIGAKGCGIEDAIKDHFSGRLVTHNSSTALIAALQDILSHKTSYEAQAKIWAEEHGWDRIIQHYLKFMYS